MTTTGAGRRALREYLERELATADTGLVSEDQIPPTYGGTCYCGLPCYRDERLCRKHAKERLRQLDLGAGTK